MQIRTGRYEGTAEGLSFEFRVEGGSGDNLRIVSGDIWKGRSPRFVATFACDNPELDGDGRTIRGAVTFRGNDELYTGRLTLSADERGVGTFQLAVDMQGGYLDHFAGRIDWAGERYRRLTVEVDGIADAEPPTAYLGHDRQAMTVQRAFEEAGFDATVLVDPFRGRPTGRQRGYSFAEIHRAMQRRRTHDDRPGLHVHVFVCSYLEGRDNRSVLGVMYDFDRGDLNKRPREGVSIFYDHPMLSDPRIDPAARQREFTYTAVHEIGHALNLLHSFDKSRPAALSWMNYPDLFPRGYEAAGRDGTMEFWRKFEERFDDEELRHLRHASPREIRAGGFPFGTYEEGASLPFGGTAEPRRTRLGANPLRQLAALEVELAPLKPAYDLGEPVFVSLDLRNAGDDPVSVPNALDPSEGYVRLVIRTPTGKVLTYRPPVRLCKQARSLTLLQGQRAPGFDGIPLFLSAEGPTFTDPGVYEVTAELIGVDGSNNAVSPPTRINIRPPDRETLEFTRTLWDTPAVMQAMYLQQPLVALDEWNAVEERLTRTALPDGNTTKSVFNYIAARGWMNEFAPPGEAAKPIDERKARARLKKVSSEGLPSSVDARKQAAEKAQQLEVDSTSRTLATRQVEVLRSEVPASGLFGTIGLGEQPLTPGISIDPLVRVVPRLRGKRAFADVVSWNIEHLHQQSNFPKIPNIAELIRSFRCDFWGLQEVDQTSLKLLSDAINGTGGVRYKFVVVPRKGQQSAALYRTDTTTVDQLPIPSGFFKETLNVELRNGTKVRKKVFHREPLLCEVGVRQGDASFDFRCAIVHLKSTDTDIKDKGSGLRIAAAKALAKWIKADKEDGNELDYLILGDMNAETAKQGLEPFAEDAGMRLLSVGMQEKYGEAEALTRVASQRLLDHIVVTKDAFETMPDEDIDEQIIVRSDREIANWTTDMSDHIPVAVRFILGEDKDPN